MKKKYEKFRMELVDYTPESSILVGSESDVEMVVDPAIEVEPFTKGFDETITFE